MNVAARVLLWVVRLAALCATVVLALWSGRHVATWWCPAPARKLAGAGVALADGRYPTLRVAWQLETGSLADSRHAEWPDVGTPLYLEDAEPSDGTVRLFRVGEVVGTGTAEIPDCGPAAVSLLGLFPDRAALAGDDMAITGHRYRADMGALTEVLVSEERRRRLGSELSRLWDTRGSVIKRSFGPIADDVLREMEKDGQEIKAVTLQEVIQGWLDQQAPSPDEAIDRGKQRFIGEFLKRLTASERMPRLQDALKVSWDALSRVEYRRSATAPVERVGLLDIVERYFFVRSPGRPSGFSPEVTILLRGVLYDADASRNANGRGWPHERWVTLRRPAARTVAATSPRLGRLLDHP